jgi:hypothetical protein
MKIFGIVILTCIGLLLSSPTPIGGDDHDQVAFKVRSLSERLSLKSIAELKSYALALEEYSRNGEPIMGGIHDYVDKMTKEDLEKYILNVALDKRELLEEEKFNSIVKKEETNKGFLAGSTPEPLGKLGGLHDYIFRVDNDTLVRWALTCQAHHNKITNQQDKLEFEKMSHKELIDFVLGMVNKYPGLDSSTELDRLAEQYKVQTKPFSLGGLDDYLFRQPRETLIKWALTCETHDRTVRNVRLFGGLHDYIDTLSDVDISKYIIEKAKIYKELDSGEKLESFAQKYSITYQPHPHLKQFGGLHDYIFRKDRQTLIKWALTCEAHDRYERKIQLLGGLDDMVNSWSNEKIAEYILGMAAVYPVLNNGDNLDSLATKFEIQPYTRKLRLLQ